MKTNKLEIKIYLACIIISTQIIMLMALMLKEKLVEAPAKN
jgi:hypothetical protein